MELKPHQVYFRSLSMEERDEFATFAKLSPGHIHNLTYTDKTLMPYVAHAMEIWSGGKVTRQVLLPDLFGDLVNPSLVDSSPVYPEFDIKCRFKSPDSDPVKSMLHVHCAGAAVYIDTKDGGSYAFNATEAAALATALQQAVVGHLIGRTAVRDAFERIELKRAS